ncbi:MAG: hypothetical protein DI589_04050 [Shinella sp.]|nr:MAG: hypothetical protein DI589_04050 [Shinella sp.]
MASLLAFFHVSTQAELLWVVFGFLAQLLFTGRFLIQWLASEKARQSVVPVAFWYFSMLGGVMLLAYAVHRSDPVFILGQALGVFIYARNLWLIHREWLASNVRFTALTGKSQSAGWFLPALLLVVVITLLRWLVLAFNRTDLFVDETQYWLWGQNFELGYYSKPPMIAWIIGTVTGLVGSDTPFWVRMPGAALHGITALILGALANRLHGPRTALWVVAAYLTLPAVGFGSIMFTTDTVMAPFFAAALLFHRRLLDNGRIGDALLTGLMAGLACLSKYAGVYFLIGVAIAALWRRDMRLSWLNAAAMLGAAIVTLAPNLVWVVLNGSVTFSHTADNIGWVRKSSMFEGLNLLGALEFVAAQFAVMGPLLFAVLIATLARRRDGLMAFTLPVLVIVIVQAIMNEALANWAASAYLAGTIIAVAALETRPKLRQAAIGTNAALCIALGLIAVLPIPGPDGQPLLRRFMGREAFSLQVIDEARRKGALAVVAENRSILADLFYTGRDTGLHFYSVPPTGRSMNHYQMQYALPADTAGPVLWVTSGTVPPCAGEGRTLDTDGGAYARRIIKAYRTDAACVVTR